MGQIHHFDHGWITPTISYTLSVLGSLLGLTLAARFRKARSSGERAWWTVLASVAIGGTAIWSMHFVAMMGFSVTGTPIRYDVGLTAASAILAVVAVAIGLVIALFGRKAQNVRIVIGGVIAGLGVAAMHYTGMAAMHLNGEVSYSTTLVGMSIGIAVVAASVALWLAVTVHKPLAIFASALVMGIAVNAMHFTAMFAMSVTMHAPGDLIGATATNMIVPIGATVVFGIIGLAYALMAAPTDEDREAAAYLAARREAAAAAGTFPATTGSFSANTGAFPSQNAAPTGQPDQPQRGRSALGAGNWTYRDRSR